MYYREGKSDKLYEIHLTQEDDGFCVTGYNGRRGTKLVAQPKTPRSVPYRTARYIFDNLEATKLNHRKTPYHLASRETAVNINDTAHRNETSSKEVDMKPEAEPPHSYAAQFLDALEL
ncbi:MAG: hypothetical protein MSG64_13600 [Pyrinomonadaceae bacterium MAG19_C2-C3]|nr:hypothetical protein [Pyrinomonadaceae bacterium MAG19_C2-C3]